MANDVVSMLEGDSKAGSVCRDDIRKKPANKEKVRVFLIFNHALYNIPYNRKILGLKRSTLRKKKKKKKSKFSERHQVLSIYKVYNFCILYNIQKRCEVLL